ncbi:MAG: phosphate ABC transporter ATP-binding protein [Ignavibacteria bacterium]|nr:phosphate ABC transporter ATP-binding protein [Ignavibacteria bacterium]
MEAAEAEQAGKEYEVETKNLSVSFNGRPAISDINLSVRKQTATAIIGPSGCGKSTFLRALNFMHDMIPKSKVTGEIIINKHSISEYDTVDLRKKVGMVFQKPNPFPKMSIYENVVSGLKLNGNKDKKDLNEVAENCLKHAGLWEEVKDRLKEPAVSLSGGQQQRLCIARTIAVSPEIILMDEPTSALDPISTQKIEELIFNLKKEFTILVVTHNMQQAARVSDHTAFFYMGKLIEYSRTRRMFTNPKEKLTEEYITGKFG